MLKEEHGKGAHQHRGHFPSEAGWIARVGNLGKGGGQLIPKGLKG
jgi:hypothetical protein